MTDPTGQPAKGLERTSAVLGRATETLARAGIPSPRVDAESLVAHVLGIGRGHLPSRPTLTAGQADRLAGLVAERSRRVPLQHLLGTAAFRHLELAVGPGVFVPRPETELLAGWGVGVARAASAASAGPGAAAGSAPPVVVDLCAGSGAIALSVAHEVRDVIVYAVERSPAALVWLRRNAASRVAAGDPAIEVRAADVTDPEPLADLAGRVDLVLANPPYVPAGTPVPPEVAGHDPAEAVFAGPDGLAVIRVVLARAGELLRTGGAFGVEHDDGHAGAVAALLRADGRFGDITGHRDLAGRPRYTTAGRS